MFSLHEKSKMLDIENERVIWIVDISQGKILGILLGGKPKPLIGFIEVALCCCVGNGYPPTIKHFKFSIVHSKQFSFETIYYCFLFSHNYRAVFFTPHFQLSLESLRCSVIGPSMRLMKDERSWQVRSMKWDWFSLIVTKQISKLIEKLIPNC